MKLCQSYFWIVVLEVAILIAFALMIGISQLRRRPSAVTWRVVIPVGSLFLINGAFLLWSTPEKTLKFPFNNLAFNQAMSILFLLGTVIWIIGLYRSRMLFIFHISPDHLWEITETVAAKSNLLLEDITAEIPKRPWWKRPIVFDQNKARVWNSKPYGPELWVASSLNPNKTGPFGVVIIRGKGGRRNLEFLLDALAKEFKIVEERPNFRYAWKGLFVGIGLFAVIIIIILKGCIFVP